MITGQLRKRPVELRKNRNGKIPSKIPKDRCLAKCARVSLGKGEAM